MLVIASASYILLLPAAIGALFLHIPVMKCARLAAGLIAMDFIHAVAAAAVRRTALPLPTPSPTM